MIVLERDHLIIEIMENENKNMGIMIRQECHGSYTAITAEEAMVIGSQLYDLGARITVEKALNNDPLN